ncbi:unnamed protein product [Rotaria socialis]|uniref:Uncharacterized protein n=1 Tax=Rotaria socialis TaxID=392032 RepID=A0A820UER7_9BILA|nr:unnamed protein product [Rotaria socialis]CAF3379877.1 unnamed protein product [Rotaria socialis]CAF3390523.1 unnamed protein product [Rotaria socialis]CAF3447866.1 unnamed protein product [Rotaria socialis]CAF3463096.1 unnamed protein product [Rotaria socialis]
MTARLGRSRSEIRSRSALASDPSDQLTRRKQFDEELAAIRNHSQSIWSRPDTSLTTHGHYFVDPEQIERTQTRPTSAGRHHNPHPKLVFMRTGMREIPYAYGALASRLPSRERITNKAPIIPDYMGELQDLTPFEQQGVNAFLKLANDNAKPNVVQALKNYRILMANEYECPPIGAATVCREDGSRTEFYPSIDRFRQATKNDKEIDAINKAIENPETEIKITSNVPPVQQPALTRNVRYPNRPLFHFQRRSHSHSKCPWPLARHPFRGDYSIHSDWHPRLPHHRLTCLC